MACFTRPCINIYILNLIKAMSFFFGNDQSGTAVKFCFEIFVGAKLV